MPGSRCIGCSGGPTKSRDLPGNGFGLGAGCGCGLGPELGGIGCGTIPDGPGGIEGIGGPSIVPGTPGLGVIIGRGTMIGLGAITEGEIMVGG